MPVVYSEEIDAMLQDGERRADSFFCDPHLVGYHFDRCPCDLGDSPPTMHDEGCSGCPGWGRECGAIYSPIARRCAAHMMPVCSLAGEERCS